MWSGSNAVRGLISGDVTMPGRLFLTRDLAEIADWLGAGPADITHPEPRLDLAPGGEIVVFDGERLCRMRWGMIMSGRVNARKRPVMETIINARSETVFGKSAFAGVRRCLVPVDGWYEWTGKTRRKTRWRIRPHDATPLAFAGIYDVWNGPGGVEVPQVATITCEPNAEIGDIHHRMGVVLPRGLWAGWLSGEAVAMDPAPDGSFVIEDATEMERSSAQNSV